MWCDNCCLFCPLRAGGSVYAAFLALYQIAGAILLFRFGDFFFFHYPEAQIYGGYAAAQGVMASLMVIAFSNKNYMWTRVCFRLYPIIVFLGAVRAGIMAWELDNFKSNIVWECQNGGLLWQPEDKRNQQPDQYDPTKDHKRTMPMGFCDAGVDRFTAFFTTCLVIDFVLMLYLLFLIWRFYIRLRHFPMQPGKYDAYD